MTEYKEENLPDLLPLYYRRLFPQTMFHQWLCYGNPKQFNKREISFTLFGDIYIRYQSFTTLDEFIQTLIKKIPIKIDIGAIYEDNPQLRTKLVPVERELVFDIDMTDYDDVRTCCSGADVCSKCWKFMSIACKIVDEALREDFGFRSLLWVFSGRRGIHCWVADASARRLDDSQRSAVVEYLQIFKSAISTRKVKIPGHHIHAALERALKIIDEYFTQHILPEQDFLGTAERLSKFLSNLEMGVRDHFQGPMEAAKGSVERWRAFEAAFLVFSRESNFPRSMRFLVEEMKLYYAYPRLDVNVSKSMNHLLKAPFCVHPKTGKVSVPFNAKLVDNFDINAVPTISQLVDEINAYDAKTKEQEKDLMEVVADSELVVNVKIKDYKKTSLLKPTNIFNEFLRGLKNDNQNGNLIDF